MGGAFVNARADRDAFFFITSHSLSVDVSLERSVTLVRYLSFDVRGDERAFSFLALSAPRSSWSTSTLGCGSRRGRRACSCTRGRTPGCWPQRRPCRRCGSCGSGTPCGKRCGGELEASGEGKRESGGREIFVRRVAAPVRLGDLLVGGCLFERGATADGTDGAVAGGYFAVVASGGAHPAPAVTDLTPCAGFVGLGVTSARERAEQDDRQQDATHATTRSKARAARSARRRASRQYRGLDPSSRGVRHGLPRSFSDRRPGENHPPRRIRSRARRRPPAADGSPPRPTP